MNHYKTVTIPAKTEQRLDFVTCDLCKKKIEEKGSDVNEVEILHREGYRYPEAASVTTTSFDMCGECFETKLMPWLTAQGATPQIEETAW